MSELGRFSIAGIPVRIRPVFFVMIVVLGLFYPWPYPVTWVIIATASVLVHELGHAVAFRAFGLRPHVELHGWGGLTSAATDDPGAPEFTPAKSIVASLAGPLSALVLFGLPAYLVARGMAFDPWLSVRFNPRRPVDPAEILVAQALYINIGWSLLNLIPVLPLDGGNVTASVFELFTPRHGRRLANVVSIIVALVLAAWGWSVGVVFAPLFALLFIGVNARELAASRYDGADRELVEATRSLVDFDPRRAESLVASAQARGLTGERARWAYELRAWARLAAGDAVAAQHLVVAMPADAGATATLRGAVALAAGRTNEGVATLAWAFAHEADRHTSVLGAMAVAQTRQVDGVVAELLRMGPDGRDGLDRLRHLLHESGHRADAARVAEQLSASAPRPPGWT